MKNSRSFLLPNGLTHAHSSNCKKTFRTLKLTHTFWLTHTVTVTKAHLSGHLRIFFALCQTSSECTMSLNSSAKTGKTIIMDTIVLSTFSL